MWPPASPPEVCFYCGFFQTLLHQNMVAVLSQQGKQQGTEAACERQRDDGSGCAVQLGPHKQAGEGQQQQGQGGDIAKQLPAEAGAHAAVQPVEAGGKVGQLQVGTYQQGTLNIAGGHALAEGDAAHLPLGGQGERAVRGGQGLGRGDHGSPVGKGIGIALLQQAFQLLRAGERRLQHYLFTRFVGVGAGDGQHGTVLQPETGDAVHQHQGEGKKTGPGMEAAYPFVVVKGNSSAFHRGCFIKKLASKGWPVGVVVTEIRSGRYRSDSADGAYPA